jgi:signal peptidase I
MAEENPRRRQEPGENRGNSFSRSTMEFLITVLVAFALVFGFVRPVVAQSFWIPSESMVPTLEVHDRILVNKFIYDFTSPKRGDIAVFKSVEGNNEDLIKRVIGLPGDKIEVRHRGTLYLNGKPQKEPYVVNGPCVRGYPKTCSFGPVTVSKGHYFMMGDNRANSLDSRFFGAVPKQNLIGEEFFRFWPLNRIGLP